MSFYVALTALSLVACGGGWSDADAKSAAAAARAQAMIQSECDEAGDCHASRVRALSRMSYCANASMLAQHGLPAVDAGIACQP